MTAVPVLLLALVLLPATAWSQPAPVTPADLEGATVEARVTMNQVIQREGRQFPVQNHHSSKIRFLPNDSIDFTLWLVSDTPRGRRQSPTRSGKTALGKPRELNSLGGGDAVWFFEDNTLTLLRAYKGGGGYKRTIAFERKGDTITCNARETYVREEGVSRISMLSPIDGVQVVMISAKIASTSCKVTLKKPVSG